MATTVPPSGTQEQKQRWRLLVELEKWLELPMAVLGFVWLTLLIMDLVGKSTSLTKLLVNAIWVIFVAEFALRLFLAPKKLLFLRKNWLTLLSLTLPALRVLRLSRVFFLFRAGRSFQLVRMLGSLNRGMHALRTSMARHGAGYVVALTVIVTLAGAAGMYFFEAETPHGFQSYADAVWWTAMLITTIGSAFWPATAEGKFLCLLLSLYGLGVLGYITALLASLFIDKKPDKANADSAKLDKLCAQMEKLSRRMDAPDRPQKTL